MPFKIFAVFIGLLLCGKNLDKIEVISFNTHTLEEKKFTESRSISMRNDK